MIFYIARKMNENQEEQGDTLTGTDEDALKRLCQQAVRNSRRYMDKGHNIVWGPWEAGVRVGRIGTTGTSYVLTRYTVDVPVYVTVYRDLDPHTGTSALVVVASPHVSDSQREYIRARRLSLQAVAEEIWL